MAEAAISILLELLGQKVKYLIGVKGKVESLKAELRRMQCFLEDANKKQVEDASVRNWISEIRELALDAQDTIEMFLINVEKANNGGSLKTYISFPKRFYHLNKIGDAIESIQERLKEVDKSRERYGITVPDVAAGPTRKSQVELRRRLFPQQKDEHPVGIQDDVKKLVRESILDEEKKGLSTAVIKGFGGIGKSTLAQAIYNHPDVVVRGQFDRRAWVVVSSEFTPQETIKQLILELDGADKKELCELEESTKDEHYLLQKLREMLHQHLQGNNYFIVLDDVWEQKDWESLRSVFPNEQDNRGRLLITTRNKITTEYGQYEHKMKELDSEKSWELMLKKASINEKCPEELESVGRQIVEKCYGLPLAISVVGGLLMGTRTKSGWERFLNQINSYLGGAQSDVGPILELSYQNLSPQLKPCFLCVAFFKEDYSIKVERLIDIWVAQGLIEQDGSSTIDEIGRGYLNELINRSMLQIDRDLTLDDRVENCRIHDILRDVCLSKAKEEMGLRNAIRAASADESSYKIRHHVDYVKDVPRTFSPEQNKHIRSLFLINVDNVLDLRIPSNYWKSFQLLKTLDLDDFDLPRLPRSFRLLLGLKYLRISSHIELQIPNWFDHLKKLEVFEVLVVRFPNAPLKMESMRHFRARVIEGRPLRIQNWINVETLNQIRAWDLAEISSTVTACSRLREFGMRIEREGADVVSRAIASLQKMTNLVKLELMCLPHLYSLSDLKLVASVFPPNLSYLKLKATLDEDPMEELGKLPNLMYLELWSYLHKAKGIDLRLRVSHDGFPCLEALSLGNMEDLRGMDIEEGGMPRLKRLRSRICPNLETQNLPGNIIVSSY